jgi:hypothetical protein
MKNYAIAILERELKNEKNILRNHKPEIKKAKYEEDRKAFTDSVQLAMDRIPSLQKALSTLRQLSITETLASIEYSKPKK